jgi:hypothetical protein
MIFYAGFIVGVAFSAGLAIAAIAVAFAHYKPWEQERT